MTQLQQLLRESQKRLSLLSESASLDAQVLVAHILGTTRAWLLAHPQAKIDPQHEAELSVAMARLESGEPLPYILGHWEFYNLRFNVTPDVLIPRPETELLVDQALKWLGSDARGCMALEIGAGSGCISVALAANMPNLHVLALDISRPALAVASANIARHALRDRIWLLQADLEPPVRRRFDLICANLPYIPSRKLASLAVARREPHLALDGGPDGLDLIRRTLSFAPNYLTPGGLVLLEIEAEQGDLARRLAEESFAGAQIQVLPDLAGHQRLLQIRV